MISNHTPLIYIIESETIEWHIADMGTCYRRDLGHILSKFRQSYSYSPDFKWRMRVAYFDVRQPLADDARLPVRVFTLACSKD